MLCFLGLLTHISQPFPDLLNHLVVEHFGEHRHAASSRNESPTLHTIAKALLFTLLRIQQGRVLRILVLGVVYQCWGWDRGIASHLFFQKASFLQALSVLFPFVAEPQKLFFSMGGAVWGYFCFVILTVFPVGWFVALLANKSCLTLTGMCRRHIIPNLLAWLTWYHQELIVMRSGISSTFLS